MAEAPGRVGAQPDPGLSAKPDGRAGIDAYEAAILAAVVLLALLATVSLVAAYLGVHAWPLVVGVSTALAGALVMAVRRWSPVPVRRPARSTWLIVPVLLIAAFLVFPGFRYATGDKDPGIYVLHGLSIADTGELRVPTPELLQTGGLDDPETDLPGPTKWRGFVWTGRGPEVLPSFYHLWPALLGTAFDAVGFSALAVVNPLIGVLSVALAFALGRRLSGVLVGAGFAVVLATNMMHVWQARYPTTETFAQALFLGAALAVTMALHTRNAALAVAGGALVTVGFLNRGEGVALVVLAAAITAVAIGFRRHQRVALWFSAGLLAPLPFAFYQAYVVAENYSETNGVPRGTVVAGLLGVAAVAAAVVRSTAIGAKLVAAGSTIGRRVAPVRVRWGLTALAVGLFVYGIIRPLFGDDYLLYAGVTRIRSHDERSLHRLAWFFSWPGLVLALAGLIWVIWARWRTDRAVVVGTSFVFFLIFLYHARNSPYLMWWGRRFVPVVVPGVALLLAMSVATAQALRRRAAVPVALALVVGVAAYQFSQSVGLRGHDEKAGSYGVAQIVASTSGGQRGLYLWEQGPCCAAAYLLFGSSTWIIGDVDTAMLPVEPDDAAAFIRQVVAAAGDQPVFTVTQGSSPPMSMSGLRFQAVRRVSGELPVWEEQWNRRPDRAIAYGFDFVISRVTAV